MHVGYDLLFLDPGRSGGRETYARELLGALRAARPAWHVTAFVSREAIDSGPGWWSVADRVLGLPNASARIRFTWARGELLQLPRIARSAGIELLHSPANFAPLHGSFRRVVTVHDVIYRRLPDTVSAPVRWATHAMAAPAARRAHRVITVSRASREDVIAELGVQPGRVEVVPNGVAAPAPGDAAAGRALAGVADGQAMALCVAGDVAHKNLGALVEAAALLDGPALVLAGHGTERHDGERVRGLGAVEPWQLEDLYAGADLLVTATRYEGFGLPVLEAMARGVPVACSDLPVLREVAGDAALYLDPGEPRSIADAIARLAAGGPEVEALRAAGRERAARFTWAQAAEATAAVYEAAMA